jgi:ATP-dependent helicase/nuclease subunit B
MSVRFVIGRAGTGKTHRCIEAVRERLRLDPLNGPRLILLVPEQAALQMERALLEAPDDLGDALAASHRAEVLSFRRLAYRVLESAGRSVGVALSEPARAMVLRFLAARHAGELRYYGRLARVAGKPGRLSGLLEGIGSTIAELIEEAVAPDELRSLTGDDRNAGLADADDAAQSAKLHDIALLYEAYLDYLGTERADPSQYLQFARSVMATCHWLHGAELWVDGFASFSGQERLTLLQLARLCSKVEITAFLDPRLIEGRKDGPPGASKHTWAGAGLFARMQRTYQDLVRGLDEASLGCAAPVVLRSDPPPRFADRPQLASLETRLFAVMPRQPESPNEAHVVNDARATGAIAGSQASATGQVQLVELPSRRHEVEYAVARIMEWVQSQETAYRYRDISIIVRDLDPYHDLLSAALSARGIPFFIDRRRPIAHHPLVELLRSAVALATESLSLESVRSLLKTGLLPVSSDDADELENFLIAHGIAGVEAWRGDDWTFPLRSSITEDDAEPSPDEVAMLDRVNAARRAFLRVFEGQHLSDGNSADGWLNRAWASSMNGREWAEALIELLKRVEAGAKIKQWADQAEADGDLDQAEVHTQAWRDVTALIDDLSFALAESSLSVRELGEVLEAGLSGLTLGLVPPMIDQVLVGSIERTRHPPIKAAIVIGVNDGVFPKRPAEDAILNDDDRLLMQERGLRIGAPMCERVHDESSLFYIAMTRASESVVVTYATSDHEGKVLRPSPYVSALCATCPGMVPNRIGDPVRTRETWDVLSARDLCGRVAAELRTRPLVEDDDTPVRARWNELYMLGRQRLEFDSIWQRALSALDARNEATLAPSSIERLHGGRLNASVSRLETYAACPFQYFARYGLDLHERKEAQLEPIDIGNVHHAILEEFVQSVADRDCGLGGLSDLESEELLSASCEQVAGRLRTDSVVSNARNAYLLRRTKSQLARVLSVQREAGRAGAVRPRAAELAFGFDRPGSLPALELETPSGRCVLLRGYIDRVDLAELSDELLGVVVDYKRKGKRVNLSHVYHGMSLQLITYLLVLAEHGKSLTGRPIRPIAALYVGSRSSYKLVEDPSKAEAAEQDSRKAHRPRGIICFDAVEALDAELGTSNATKHYQVKRRKEGGISDVDKSDGATGPDFDAVLKHTRRKLGELADGILSGDFSIKPFRLRDHSPCSWCAMLSVCRHESGITSPRFLDALKRSEVFRQLSKYQTDSNR